jgi:apolipoprotein N-acyltransferase
MPRLYQTLFGAGWRGHVLSLIAGALLPLGLAPFDLWPLALMSVIWLVLGLDNLNGRQCIARSYAFGLGMFTTGVSWVYVSINTFGQAPMLLAALLTLLFAAGLAIVFCLPFGLLGRYFKHNVLALPFALPALWLLGEWLRSWFLTGFPWLYIGYSQLQTPLAGYAPVLGVMGVGLIVLFSACSLALLLKWLLQSQRPAFTLSLLTLSAACWLGGIALKQVEWTQVKGDAISVGMIQPNIPQAKKWDPDFYQLTVERFRRLSEPLWQNDWLIWPEAAIPKPYHRASEVLDEFQQRAAETNTGLITGVLYDDYRRDNGKLKVTYYNAMIGMGRAQGIYHKTQLVPFGEYLPFESLRSLIHFFNLPTSIISPWIGKQRGIQVGATMVMPSICYEIAYPALVAEGAAKADVLLTVSNDAWFGNSIAPNQHMQIAQMRALETGRYLIRATNNGLSGIINSKGEITVLGAQFVQISIKGEVYATKGLTPYVRYGDVLGLTLAILMLLAAAIVGRGLLARHH